MQAPEEKARGITISTAHGASLPPHSCQYFPAFIPYHPLPKTAAKTYIFSAAQWNTRPRTGTMPMLTAPATRIT